MPESARLSSLNIVMALAFPPLGLMILRARPHHLIGWIFLGIGLGQALGQFSYQYAFYTLEVHPGALPLGLAFYWLYDYLWYPSFGLFVLLLALFPEGSSLTRRWRALLWMLGGGFALFTLIRIAGIWTDPQSIGFHPPADAPYTLWTFLFDTTADLLILSLVGAVLSLILRFRRSSGVERQQLKWIVFAGLIFGLAFLFISVLSAWPVFQPEVKRLSDYQFALALARVLFPLSAVVFPLAVGLAITRYRLYGIDVLIRRTLIYSSLTVLLALLYVADVLALQALFFWVTRQTRSELSIILSTLLIAASFAPLRGRVQANIDRRFYRQRYDIETALSSFREMLRQEVDLQAIIDSTKMVIEETIQPVEQFIWLLPSPVGGWENEATAPAGDGSADAVVEVQSI